MRRAPCGRGCFQKNLFDRLAVSQTSARCNGEPGRARLHRFFLRDLLEAFQKISRIASELSRLSVGFSSWRSRTTIRMFTEHCRSLNVRSLFAFDNRWPLHERTVRSLFVLFPFRDMSVCSLFETYLGNRTTWKIRRTLDYA